MEEFLVQAAVAAAKVQQGAQTAHREIACSFLNSLWNWGFLVSWIIGVLGTLILLVKPSKKTQ